jgi:hypothetical protein
LSANFPALSIASSITICLGSSTTLSAGGASSYSWSTGAQTSSIAISPSVSTVYTVTGTSDHNSCSITKTVIVNVVSCTGIQENNNTDRNIKIYPNPVNSILFIELNKTDQILIFDQLDRVVLSKNLISGRNEINIQTLEKGIYYLKFYSLDNKGYRIIKME